MRRDVRRQDGTGRPADCGCRRVDGLMGPGLLPAAGRLRAVRHSVRPPRHRRFNQLSGGKADDEGNHTLADITMPTLIIHGTDDPVFPPGYATALKKEIPDAELLLLDGVGHQPPPPPTWSLVLPAIAAITSTRPPT